MLPWEALKVKLLWACRFEVPGLGQGVRCASGPRLPGSILEAPLRGFDLSLG